MFTGSFDNYLTLPYAVIICLWGKNLQYFAIILTFFSGYSKGSIFSEYWKREEKRLAYDWNTENFHKKELDRVEYSQELQKYRKKIMDPYAEFPEYQRYLKHFVSLLVTLLAVNFMIFFLLY